VIDSLYQSEIDGALDDQVRRPQPRLPPRVPFSVGGLLKAPFQGVGSGAAEMLAFGSEVTGAFGQVAGAYPEALGVTELSDQQRKQTEEARRKLLSAGVEPSNEAGDIFRQRARDIMPDPESTHASAQVVAGLSAFATKAAGYAVGFGPAAPALFGGDVALTEADKLKQEGVDVSTRTKAAAVQGVVAGASLVVPIVGKTAAQTVGLVGVAGPGGFVAQTAAERSILKGAGYDKLAEQYDPLDPVGLALATLVPAAFGTAAYRAGRGTPAKTTGAIRSEAGVREAVQLTPAEQAVSDAYERSAANLNDLRAAIKSEKNPENRAILEAELTKQQAAADGKALTAAARTTPELVDAARVSMTAKALDSSRLTPDTDLPGLQAHQDAIERASDQMAAGEAVSVTDTVGALPEPVGEALRTRFEALHQEPAPEPVRMPAAPEPFAAAMDRMRASLETTGRRGLDITEPMGRVLDMLKGGRPEEIIARAAEAGQEIHPTVNNLLIGAAETGGDRAKLGGLVDHFTQEALTAKPGAEAHEIVAKAVERSRAGPAEPSTKPAPLQTAATEVAALNPDMLVHMDDQMAPTRIGDLLERINREADEQRSEATLIQAAANCFLRQ